MLFPMTPMRQPADYKLVSGTERIFFVWETGNYIDLLYEIFYPLILHTRAYSKRIYIRHFKYSHYRYKDLVSQYLYSYALGETTGLQVTAPDGAALETVVNYYRIRHNAHRYL